MKEDVLEILMYLFERHMDDNCHMPVNEDLLVSELQEAGFPDMCITKAFDWLAGLARLQDDISEETPRKKVVRLFSPYESLRLDVDCRGFILYLEEAGVVNSVLREMIIDRVMDLETDTINLSQIKWVTLMVLFNQPDKDLALARMEHLVLNDRAGTVH